MDLGSSRTETLQETPRERLNRLQRERRARKKLLQKDAAIEVDMERAQIPHIQQIAQEEHIANQTILFEQIQEGIVQEKMTLQTIQERTNRKRSMSIDSHLRQKTMRTSTSSNLMDLDSEFILENRYFFVE